VLIGAEAYGTGILGSEIDEETGGVSWVLEFQDNEQTAMDFYE
jgi:hypothetical protein